VRWIWILQVIFLYLSIKGFSPPIPRILAACSRLFSVLASVSILSPASRVLQAIRPAKSGFSPAAASCLGRCFQGVYPSISSIRFSHITTNSPDAISEAGADISRPVKKPLSIACAASVIPVTCEPVSLAASLRKNRAVRNWYILSSFREEQAA